MELREREQGDRPAQNASGPTADAAGGQLEELRSAGGAALQAGGAAIDRVLSGDSLQYNRETQQTGGQ